MEKSLVVFPRSFHYRRWVGTDLEGEGNGFETRGRKSDSESSFSIRQKKEKEMARVGPRDFPNARR